MKEKPIWKRNLSVLSIAVFIAGIAFSEIMPFLSLYINTLGNFSHQQLSFWSGIVYSGTFIVSAIVSPWWGKLADKKGRKPMILRAGIGMSLVIASMGLVQNVWQLLLLRMLQGVFAGFISNSNALVATETPKINSGQALGTIASATTAGTLLGPLVGGALTSIFSYRITFMITGGLLLICSILVLFFVHEDDFKPVTTKKLDKASGVIKSLRSPHLIFGLLLTTLIIQAANNSINPIVSLYVRQLLNDTHKIIVAGFIAASIFFFLTAFVQNTVELGILRFLVGFSDACLFPQVQTMLTKNSPAAVTGRIFSWNQSAMYIGNIVGPLLGSFVSGMFNYSMVFIVTTVIVLINLLLFRINVIQNLAKK